MNRLSRMIAAAAVATSVAFSGAEAAGLKGSMASMRQQHRVATSEDLAFLRTPTQVRSHAAEGRLDTVPGNANYRVNKVSYPYAQPEVLALIERVALGYRAYTGERLVVTSLTRPSSKQPGNAHRLSVHPAGMAVDLRVPAKPSARKWLETTLLRLEREGVLDVTRERRPPHYHVAVFPEAYREYAAANPLPEPPPPIALPALDAVPLLHGGAGAIADVASVDARDPANWILAALAGLFGLGGLVARRREAARVAGRGATRVADRDA